MDHNRLERFLSFLQDLVHEACLPYSQSKRRYPVDQDVLTEVAYYGTLLYLSLTEEPMEESELEGKDVRKDAAAMNEEKTAFFCEKMNEIIEEKTIEKTESYFCLCPDFHPLRRRIEAWFQKVEEN